MKRPIYFDERERELARRICDYVIARSGAAYQGVGGDRHESTLRLACRWLDHEVAALRTKFGEPTPTEGEPR